MDSPVKVRLNHKRFSCHTITIKGMGSTDVMQPDDPDRTILTHAVDDNEIEATEEEYADLRETNSWE